MKKRERKDTKQSEYLLINPSPYYLNKVLNAYNDNPQVRWEEQGQP